MSADDINGHDVIADVSVNVEGEALHNIMLENLKKARKTLSSDGSFCSHCCMTREKQWAKQARDWEYLNRLSARNTAKL